MDEEIKILCVDDEQNVLNTLKRLFIDDNYTILTATSGQEGLNILEQEQVQVIISDYRMPGMNGVEFLRGVYERWPHTVRIVLSGYADTASIVSAINEGRIYKFVAKPWNDDELKVAVSNAIERYFLYKKNIELTTELKTRNEELTKLNDELKQLLKEKSENLEFRSQVLVAHQNILDAMPVAIIGIDLNDLIVLCNSAWNSLSGDMLSPLGQSAHDSMPEVVVNFIEEVKVKKKASKRMALGGIDGKLLGSHMDHKEQKGIILVFVGEDNIP